MGVSRPGRRSDGRELFGTSVLGAGSSGRRRNGRELFGTLK